MRGQVLRGEVRHKCMQPPGRVERMRAQDADRSGREVACVRSCRLVRLQQRQHRVAHAAARLH